MRADSKHLCICGAEAAYRGSCIDLIPEDKTRSYAATFVALLVSVKSDITTCLLQCTCLMLTGVVKVTSHQPNQAYTRAHRG